MFIKTLPTTFVAIAIMAMVSSASAATLYWDASPGTPDGVSQGGTGTWDTSTAKWDDGANYNAWNNANNDTAVFDGTAGTVTLGAPITVGGLQFNVSGYTINSNNLTLAAGTVINTAAAGNTSIGSATTFVGTNGFTKTGTGILFLESDTNSLSGAINIQAGELRAHFGAIGAGDIVFTGDSNFTKDYGANGNSTNNFTINSGVTASIGGSTFYYNFNTTGVLAGDATTTLQMNGGGNTQKDFNNTANTFTGTLYLNGGGVGSDTNENGARAGFKSLTDSSQKIRIDNAHLRLNNGGVSMNFVNRQLEILNHARIDNDSANSSVTMTFAQNLLATLGNNSRNLYLSGVNTGDNTFAGAIGNSDTGTGKVSIRKVQSGKWILAGANTYTGNTTVVDGTLVLADPGELLFDIGAAGVNNKILGSGTLNLDGDLVFDLTGASVTLGDWWNIVDVANLTETYGGTFGVRSTLGSFSETADIWTIAENGTFYEFSEATGVLTVVVPEPATLALMGLGGLLMLRRRRLS
jgi:fibronectin-binding autotransporter adhesin